MPVSVGSPAGTATARSLRSAAATKTLLVNDVERSGALKSASFYHEGRRYLVTSLQQWNLAKTLPDIMENGEFVLGLKVWLCFFREAEMWGAKMLCDGDDTTFVRHLESARSHSNRTHYRVDRRHFRRMRNALVQPKLEAVRFKAKEALPHSAKPNEFHPEGFLYQTQFIQTFLRLFLCPSVHLFRCADGQNEE
ncbi:unnamed protein product [Heligmosomoides polygyrus]|uniref:Uncharacterized protein n=1 Tax=Heligmosomoides polygyrus TaxID=6339 RepID=A0A3P8AD92_HELPZ|nr:unnamed protein product [Heligmosomoides polygyrus]